MQPLIFAEFREFVATTLPPEAEAALASLPSRAPSPEAFLTAVETVAAAADVPPRDLERRFGTHLFGRFATLYPVFFVEAGSALTVLAELDGKVHAEVQKLHPDARFPSFECLHRSSDGLELRYRSARPFAALAEGLIRGCIAHFGERFDVRCVEEASDGTEARFVIERVRRSR